MRNVKVWSDPIGRPSRLAELGLTEEILLQAVGQGKAAWANCTENHPALYRGIVAWGEPIRSLRENLIPVGWKRYDEANLPFILNETENLAITVATGDENTGRKERNPSTRSSKGTHTKAAIKNNALAHTLFGDIRKVNARIARVMWMLLFHIDEKSLEVRCELSHPLGVGTDGRVDEWIERVILSPIPFDGSPANISSNEPQTPNIDIDVKRRRSA